MTAINAQERHKLKKFIKDIEKVRGRHTELVSVYIPAGYDLNKVTNQLFQEQGTAVNIKSSATRKNVIDAHYDYVDILEKIRFQLNHGPYDSEHIFGDGTAGKKIAEILATIDHVNLQKTLAY